MLILSIFDGINIHRTIIHIDAFCIIITKKGILQNFTKFKGKNLCQSLFLIQLQALGPDIKRLWHRSFPLNFAKFLRTPFLIKHLQWLLLSKMWLALQFSIFHMSSFIEDFLVISFQQKNFKKGNTLIEFKHLTFSRVSICLTSKISKGIWLMVIWLEKSCSFHG